MPNFTIAIWENDAIRWGKLTLDLRLKKTRKAVRKALAHHQTTNAGNTDSIGGVFVAREYLFDTPLDGKGTLNGAKQLTGPYYAGQLIKEMKSLTLGSNLLVIPGTVAQRDPITLVEKRELTRAIRKYYNMVRLQKNTVYTLYESALLRRQTTVFSALLTKLGKMVPNGTVSVVRNTAYGFLAGQEVLRYHKRAEIGEVQDGSPDVFVNGTEPGIVRSTGGLTLGVEVCLDSSQGYLAQTKIPLDFHIVLSEDGKDDIERNCSKYLILASRAAGHSGVYSATCNLQTSTGNAQASAIKVDGFWLRYYSVAV